MCIFHMTVTAGEEISRWASPFYRGNKDKDNSPRWPVRISKQAILIYISHFICNFYNHSNMEPAYRGFYLQLWLHSQLSSPFCPGFVADVTRVFKQQLVFIHKFSKLSCLFKSCYILILKSARRVHIIPVASFNDSTGQWMMFLRSSCHLLPYR